jgi:hypothetical protein
MNCEDTARLLIKENLTANKLQRGFRFSPRRNYFVIIIMQENKASEREKKIVRK